uniref:Aggrecan core protein n=1 Tax=Magallana gigas TaxID=29159 RepID=K1RHW6_MAGGI
MMLNAVTYQIKCYQDHEENVTKNQYCFIKSSFNWKNAKEKCQSLRSHLLEINTEAEQIWLNDKVYGDTWWTGGVRDENGTDWVWNNSSSKMVFKNWDTAQPNNYAGEDCVLIICFGRTKEACLHLLMDNLAAGHPVHLIEKCSTISKFINSYGGLWWTGAIKDRNKNIWVWDHSDTEMVFTNWDPDGSQPNGESTENCVLTKYGLWHDFPCQQTFNIICERGE